MFGGANVRIERTLVLDNDSCGIQLFDYGDHVIENCLVGYNGVDGIYKFVDLPKQQPGNPMGWTSVVRRSIVVGNGRYGLANFWVGEFIAECTDVYGSGTDDFFGFDAFAGDAQGNISADPLFCFPDTGNYYIRDNSQCAPANNSCGEQIGTLAVKCTCCIGVTGNVNKSPLEGPDLSDLSLLVSYLTANPRPELPCPAEANLNQHEGIDISDLSAMLFYLTSMMGFRVLASCPVF